MSASTVAQLAERALPLMNAADRAEAEALLAELRTANAADETLAEWTRRAAAAFQQDMQPVCEAIAAALHAGDLGALRGLRALLSSMLAPVHAQPALADLLAHQLGQTLIETMTHEAHV